MENKLKSRKLFFWQDCCFLWLCVDSKLIMDVVYWGTSLFWFSLLPCLPEVTGSGHHTDDLSYTPRLYCAHCSSTLWDTPQTIDRDGTGRVNKELEVQQGKRQLQLTISREEQDKDWWVGTEQAPSGLLADQPWSEVRDHIISICHCCSVLQAPALTLPTRSKAIQDGSCKQMSCTKVTLGSSGDVKMTVCSHHYAPALYDVRLLLSKTSQEHGIRQLYCKNS